MNIQQPLNSLITPYGGNLVDLYIPENEAADAKRVASTLPSVRLTNRNSDDLELLACGAFSPLTTFMSQKDYQSVLSSMSLADGTLFPIPITLPVFKESNLKLDMTIALRDSENNIVATMHIEDMYNRDFDQECISVFGTRDTIHPLISEMHFWGDTYISGLLRVFRRKCALEYSELIRTPLSTRMKLAQFENAHVVAFQTRNPMHRVHEELTKRAARQTGATLLLHPTVGITRAEDVDRDTRVKTYRAMNAFYKKTPTLLSLIPLAMRFAGPREAVWHAIIRRNYGADYFIIGRDHASPGLDSRSRPFYQPYEAQSLLESVQEKIGISPVFMSEIVYLPGQKKYITMPETKGAVFKSLSGSQVRREYLNVGKPLPFWFTRPEVASILSKAYPRSGCCLWFTGLPSSGKSTIAACVYAAVRKSGRTVTMLDGDVIRTHLSAGLGYSKRDRDANILRIGFVASEIVRHNGIVICAAVSPYEAARNCVRNRMPEGTFVLIYVNTPIGVCKKRDSKGLYKQSDAGAALHVTGVDDTYEIPVRPDMILDAESISPDENAKKILHELCRRGIVLIQKP